MIYIASPYTGTPAEQEYRYSCALFYVNYLIHQEKTPYSPIVHFHDVAKRYDLPKDHKFYRVINTDMLRRADTLHVLMISGLENSKGVKFEIELADKLNLPVKFISPHLFKNILTPDEPSKF